MKQNLECGMKIKIKCLQAAAFRLISYLAFHRLHQSSTKIRSISLSFLRILDGKSWMEHSSKA